VVLLDEIEKAHDDVYNILLQLLDDGRLTDNKGNTVDFTNTIVVMTSNIGSQLIQKITESGGSTEEMQTAMEQALKAKFAPEFLNRIDEKIIFRTLNEGEIRKIVDLQLNSLERRVAELGWTLNVTETARAAIADEGYDPQYGARPLKRVIQQKCENPLATEILKIESPDSNKTITIDFVNDEYLFRE
jgi:ATP-dependent Clp protease ATP-binding subunit ClpB